MTLAEELDEYLNHYNWDDGFSIPYLINSPPDCKLATAVSAFWVSEAMAYFDDNYWVTPAAIQ